MSLFESRFEIAVPAVGAVDEWLQEQQSESWSVVEDVIVQRAWLVGIFSDAEAARASTDMLVRELPLAPLSPPHIRELQDADWRDSYKQHFRAWKFGRLHWVPEWERTTYQLPAGHEVLWLDPGLAFGTGNHETTRLCVERLVEWSEMHGAVGRVVDAGCGSGILALSAAKLGFSPVTGFDNDPEAVRISSENAVANDLRASVAFSVADLVSGLQGVQAHVLMANILADVLVQYRHDLVAAVAPGGTLILSGILSAERDHVLERFAELRPEWQRTSHILGEWSDVVLTRPPQ